VKREGQPANAKRHGDRQPDLEDELARETRDARWDGQLQEWQVDPRSARTTARPRRRTEIRVSAWRSVGEPTRAGCKLTGRNQGHHRSRAGGAIAELVVRLVCRSRATVRIAWFTDISSSAGLRRDRNRSEWASLDDRPYRRALPWWRIAAARGRSPESRTTHPGCFLLLAWGGVVRRHRVCACIELA
jgi:hypothetical protein